MGVFNRFFVHSVTLQKFVTTTSTSGGPGTTWSTRTASVASLISTVSGAGTNTETMKVVMETAATSAAELSVGDRLLVVTGPTHLVGKYLAIESLDRHATWFSIPELSRANARLVDSAWQPQ